MPRSAAEAAVVTSAEQPATIAPITGLSHIQLMVSDIEASARWYRTVLSLSPYAEDLDLGYVALRQRDAKIVVVLTRRSGTVDPALQPARDVLDHLAFAASDGDSLRAWAAHLSEVGIEHAGVVLENGHPSLQLRDPDGIAVELVAP
jgi:glyoxylase I family protein